MNPRVRSQALYGRKDALTQEIDSLSTQNLTSQSLPKLRENLEKNESELQVFSAQRKPIYPRKLNTIFTQNKRYERESQEQRKERR